MIYYDEQGNQYNYVEQPQQRNPYMGGTFGMYGNGIGYGGINNYYGRQNQYGLVPIKNTITSAPSMVKSGIESAQKSYNQTVANKSTNPAFNQYAMFGQAINPYNFGGQYNYNQPSYGAGRFLGGNGILGTQNNTTISK